MPEEFNNIDGRPAIETDEPLSIQEANVWAIEQRDKADPRKAAVERLRCAAAKRRELKPANPLETLKPNPTYKVGEFNPEADAFNVESSDGKKLLGKSLSNGNVRNGQKVRSFFTPSGQVVIDVKPKGRDIVIPKPEIKASIEQEVWPCISAFLYSKIKLNQELLDANGAVDADETTWDALRCFASPTGSIDAAVVFFEQKNLLGDYDTSQKALLNQMRADRLVATPNSPSASAARDNLVWGSGSAEAVICWYYIGNSADAFTGGKIFKVSGPPTNINAGDVTEPGPGFCMEVYSGTVSAAIFPSEGMARGPLTKELSKQFPDLGGKIGYAGRIEKWRAVDYYSTSFLSYFRKKPSINEPNKTPVSFPSWYTPNPNVNPWTEYTDADWFQFGWPDPTSTGCASTSWILAIKSSVNAVGCGGGIPNDAWYWGGDAAPTIGRIDKDNSQGFIGTTGIYVCWAGHKENMGRAQSFFEAFRTYWGIAGSVTYLGSCNPYGCEILPPGGNYPPAPPNNVSRFVGQNWGRKAEMWLKVCRQNDKPVELKLPFEYCAVLEKRVILGGGSFGSSANFESGKTRNSVETCGNLYTGSSSFEDSSGLENPHATLAIDDEYAYVDILYGCERIYEQPLIMPVKSRLGNQGFGGVSNNFARRVPGQAHDYIHHISGAVFLEHQQAPQMPILIKDVFTSCQSYKIKLPTKSEKTLTIVGSQKFKRGEVNTLTNKNPDWECTQKFSIHDYRTSVSPYNNSSTIPNFTQSNPEFATFGGLPALTQLVDLTPSNINNLSVKYYTSQSDWTALYWIYFQLMGSPRQFNPLNYVLPLNVYISPNATYNAIIFDSDRKFGGHGRCEIAMPITAFGNINNSTENSYNTNTTALFPTAIPFTEQLIGNGLMENNKIIKWYRVTASSFPILGQSKRNP